MEFSTSVQSLLLVAIVAYFVGGAVKGSFGLGMPITVVSAMSFVSDTRTAILLVLMPIVITNLLQMFSSGNVKQVFVHYWRLALTMSVFLMFTSAWATDVPGNMVTLSVGAAVILFASMNLWFHLPAISDRMDSKAQVVAGVTTGVLGGITGLVVVPLLAYFTARDLDKESFVRSTCPFFLLGGVLLVVSYARSGLFTPTVALYSLLLVIPSVLGLVVGERLRAVIPTEYFRRIVLFLFLLMGVNLVAKSIGM